MRDEVYNRVYYRAVRRAMLENETLLRKYMDEVAVDYDIEKLEELDKLFVALFDNDLFDVIMGSKTPEEFEGTYDVALLKELRDAMTKGVDIGYRKKL